MYKSKLQELCQRRSWELPEYNTVKVGPDHMPRFTATINVRGQIFETPAQCKSAKDAQNTAAKIAFDHFSLPRPSPSPASAPSSLPPAQFQAVTAPSSEINPVTVVLPAPEMNLVPAPLPDLEPVAEDHSVSTPEELKTVAGVPPLLPLSPLPSSLPTPPPGLLVTKSNVNLKPAIGDIEQHSHEDTSQTSPVHRIAIGSHEKNCKDTLHMYKNRLQQYAQKHNRGFPVYTCEAEGPPHARRFRSRVSFDGKCYETLEYFTTLKEAEQGAAKAACQMLSADVIQEHGGLYKNLVQEFAQRKGLICPSYETVSCGMPHKPIFVSTVEIGSQTFRGAEAKTKKQAELSAAKVAYCHLTESSTATESSKVPSFTEYAVSDNVESNIQPPAMTENHQEAVDEECGAHRKRAKSSPENMDVNADLGGPLHCNSPPSDDSSLVSKSTFTEQPIENQPGIHTKTVVMPRSSMRPMPESAAVMPYSDEQWVAYKIEPKQQPTA